MTDKPNTPQPPAIERHSARGYIGPAEQPADVQGHMYRHGPAEQPADV